MDSNKQSELLSRITIVEGMMGGRPVIRSMRFPVQDILEMLSNDMTVADILEQHPILEADDIKAALLFASIKVNNTISVHAARA